MSEELDKLKKELEQLREKEKEIDELNQVKREIVETKERLEGKTKRRGMLSGAARIAENFSRLDNKSLGM